MAEAASFEEVMAALTPEEARDIVENPRAMDDFVELHADHTKGISVMGVHSALYNRAQEAPPPSAPSILVRPQRPDTVALIETMEKAVRLPRRMREVAERCLIQGLTLNQCAESMGIGRETVRTHLRQLRRIQRGWRSRASWEAEQRALAVARR